jgi:hypothetical protein
VRNRNKTLISQLFGEHADEVFYLDGRKGSSRQITEKVLACQKSNTSPLYLYMHDLQDIMITPVLLDFIKDLRYSIIGFERISLKLLKAIFDNLPQTAKKVGLDCMLSPESFTIMHSTIVLRKQLGQHIEVICGKNVYGLEELIGLSKSIFASPPMLPTPPSLNKSTDDIIQAHLATAQRIKEELLHEDMRHNLKRYSTKATNQTAVVYHDSELKELKKEINESRKKRKKNPKSQASPESKTSETKPVDPLHNTAYAPVNTAHPSLPFFFIRPTALLPSGKPYIPAATLKTAALSAVDLTPVPASILSSTLAPVAPVATMISSPSSPATSTYPCTQNLLQTQAYSLQSFLNNSSLLGYANPSAGGLFSSSAPSSFSQPTQTINSFPASPLLPELQTLLDSMRQNNYSRMIGI